MGFQFPLRQCPFNGFALPARGPNNVHMFDGAEASMPTIALTLPKPLDVHALLLLGLQYSWFPGSAQLIRIGVRLVLAALDSRRA
jgi:hypothetical protein